MSSFKAFLKALALVILCIIFVPPQLAVMLVTRGSWAYIFPRLWHAGACWAIGLRYEIVGTPLNTQHVVYIGNHISHLDIPALGSFLQASFVAKEDVRRWPVFGWLATLQQTVFISRQSRQAARVQGGLTQALTQGKSLVIFAEGTSSAGETILPFKSSVLSFLYEDGAQNTIIQPFTVDLLATDGQPVQSIDDRDGYAYYGDMIFGPHLWAFLKTRGAQLRITFHDPVSIDGENRKVLASRLHATVATGLSHATHS